MPRLKKGTFRNRGNARAKEATVPRQAEALRLRLAGATFEQIAVQMTLSGKSQAYKLVHDALLATIQEPADAVRALELARLDKLLLSVWMQAITAGPHQLLTIDRVLKIMAQRCLYVTGLKVVEQVAAVRPDGTSVYDPQVASAEFQTLMAALTARYQSDTVARETEGVTIPPPE
jgi:hypothetical protein